MLELAEAANDTLPHAIAITPVLDELQVAVGPAAAVDALQAHKHCTTNQNAGVALPQATTVVFSRSAKSDLALHFSRKTRSKNSGSRRHNDLRSRVSRQHPSNCQRWVRDFRDFFWHATSGLSPYGWQLQVALDGLPDVLPVPTGLGKTEVALAWAWRLLVDNKPEPMHLVVCLPMRSLVTQTVQRLKNYFDTLKAKKPEVDVSETVKESQRRGRSNSR